jgi:hypothetical protein
MKFPCWAIQKSEFFKDAEVIAGHAGLNHIVEHINIIYTLYGYKPFIKRNSLVILSCRDVSNSREMLSDLMYNFKEIGIAAVCVYDYEDLFSKGCNTELIALGNQLSIPIIKLQMPHTIDKIIQYFDNHIFIEFYRKFILKEEMQNQFYSLHKMGRLERFAQTLWEVTQKDVVIRLKDYEFNFCKIDIDLILENSELWVEEPLDSGKDSGATNLSSYHLKLADIEYHWVGNHYTFDRNIDWFTWLFYEGELDSNSITLFRYALQALTLEQEERSMQFQKIHQKSIRLLLQSVNNDVREKRKDYLKLVEQFGHGRVFVYQGTIDEGLYNVAYSYIKEYLNSTVGTVNNFLLGNYEEDFFVMIVQIEDAAVTKLIASAFLDMCDNLMEYGVPKVVGVGENVVATNMGRSYMNANSAVFWAKKSRRPYVLFEELGMLRYFHDEDEYRWAVEIKQRYVDILKTFDEVNNSELLVTMMILVKNLWNRNMAAKELFVHSNTVKYRLMKIQTILSVDFQEGNMRNDMEVGLSLERLLIAEH